MKLLTEHTPNCILYTHPEFIHWVNFCEWSQLFDIKWRLQTEMLDSKRARLEPPDGLKT